MNAITLFMCVLLSFWTLFWLEGKYAGPVAPILDQLLIT